MALLCVISSGPTVFSPGGGSREQNIAKTCRMCARPLDGSIVAFSICRDPPLTVMCTQVCMCALSTKDSHQGWPETRGSDQTSVNVRPDEALPRQPRRQHGDSCVVSERPLPLTALACQFRRGLCVTAVTHPSSSSCHLNLTPCRSCQHLHAEEERRAGILAPKTRFLTDSAGKPI